ncbi:MAG: magnesium/cobalt transporter CorA [Planctomycetota bacterium]|nr:magnesium/cobalt transporter CorA [Planctomycetota bacterium]
MSHSQHSDPISHLVSDAIRKTTITARRARQKFRRLSSPRHIYTAPGTIAASPDDLPTVITVFAYGPNECKEVTVTSIAEITALGAEWPVLWVNVDGFSNVALLKAIADHFNIHPLAMEDATDTAQRAKSEPYGDATFLVLPMPHEDDRGFWTEQIAIWVTAHVVVTFQGVPGDCLDPLRDRIRESKGRVRTSGAAYLSYAIADSVVDGYFPIVDRIGEALEPLEDEAFSKPDGKTLGQIRRIRAELIRVRRAVHPLRDAAIALGTLDRVFDADTRHYLRDLNDHVSRVLDQLETDRFMANDLLDIYMTSINLKVAETSKVLTIIATLFMPLTFIAGVYGMNFDHMPELRWVLGYPFALGLMGLTVIGLLAYFWRKGWLRDTTK